MINLAINGNKSRGEMMSVQTNVDIFSIQQPEGMYAVEEN